jgi:protein-S-isoprenylcysteine O-methyltransferase Ste14
MWYWRDNLKEKYQHNSYQRIIFIGLGGICLMISLAFNSITPIREINPDLWNNPSFSIWITPLTSLLGINFQYLDIIRYLISGFLFLLGVITGVRSFLTFGIDYMALVYLYFPEESKIQDFEIYSVLRHPAYKGVALISMAGFIYNFSLFSLLYLLIFLSGFSIFILFVEEKELIQRFGDSYKKYRNSVPAIFVRPKNWKKYFKFLIGQT